MWTCHAFMSHLKCWTIVNTRARVQVFVDIYLTTSQFGFAVHKTSASASAVFWINNMKYAKACWCTLYDVRCMCAAPDSVAYTTIHYRSSALLFVMYLLMVGLAFLKTFSAAGRLLYSQIMNSSHVLRTARVCVCVFMPVVLTLTLLNNIFGTWSDVCSVYPVLCAPTRRTSPISALLFFVLMWIITNIRHPTFPKC